MAPTDWPSNTGRHPCPPSVVFQTPPPALPKWSCRVARDTRNGGDAAPAEWPDKAVSESPERDSLARVPRDAGLGLIVRPRCYRESRGDDAEERDDATSRLASTNANVAAHL